MGVELVMNTRVVGVDAFGVDVEGPAGKDRIAAGTTIWAAGVQASPLARLLAEATGSDTDRSGRIAVLPDMTLPGHPEVFAVGDMASINNLPGVCEVAMQGGLHAANTIRRRLNGDTRDLPFKYRDVGSAAALGRFNAIVEFHGVRLSGLPGWVVWLFVHVAFLNGFGHRASAMWRWARSMIGSARPERFFSMGHTGGDLSLPDEIKRRVMPSPFPVFDEMERVRDAGASDHRRPEGLRPVTADFTLHCSRWQGREQSTPRRSAGMIRTSLRGVANGLQLPRPASTACCLPWAKYYMAAQSILSLVILTLVIANAVNLLGPVGGLRTSNVTTTQ